MRRRLRAVPEAARRHSSTLSAFTRQGAMAAARRMSTSRVASPARQLVLMVCGSVLIGTGVSAFRAADLGLPPYDVLLSAIDDASPLSHGQAGWMMAAILLSTAALLGQRPRLTTMLYVFTTGLTVDAAAQVITAPDTVVVRVALVPVGIAAIAGGISVVVSSGLTGGAFEMLMRAGEARGLDGAQVRLGIEIVILVTGILAGGAFGAATIVFALVIGRTLTALVQGIDDLRRGRSARLAAAAQDANPASNTSTT